MKTVIHNLRILRTETVWGQKYKKVFLELVEVYQSFFCEEIDHEENIERHDWRDGLENQKVNFDDEHFKSRNSQSLPENDKLILVKFHKLSINLPATLFFTACWRLS